MSVCRNSGYAARGGFSLFGFVVFMAGLSLGIFLFTPWGNLWERVLERIDQQATRITMTWGEIDREGPFGFRINDLVMRVAGSPGTLNFDHAYVKLGSSPLFWVRLQTGGAECIVEIDMDHRFILNGTFDLGSLLNRSDIRGSMWVNADVSLPFQGEGNPSGWFDMRSQRLILPGERVLEDMSFTAEMEGHNLNIRDYSQRTPLSIKTAGSAILNRDMAKTTFSLKGERLTDGAVEPFEIVGVLGEVITP